MKALRYGPALALSGIAIALCAALAGGAEASPREVAHLDGFLIAPSLIGREVAWMDQECPDCVRESGSTRFQVFTSGLSSTKAPLRLAQGYNQTMPASGPVSESEEIDFELSSSSLAIRRNGRVSDCCSDSSARGFLRFGARGRRLPLISGCSMTSLSRANLPYAVDGDRLLYGDPCNPESHTVVLVNRRTAERRTIAVVDAERQSIREVRLTGTFAAYMVHSEEGAQEVVVDRVDGAEGGYRIPVAPAVAAGDIALDAEGRLAVLTRAAPYEDICEGTALAWYSPAAPFAHRLPVEPCPSPMTFTGERSKYMRGPRPAIAWAGERIAFRGRPTAPADELGSASLGTQLRTVGLDSSVSVVVDAGQVALQPFDADERNLAYGLRACDGGTRLFVVSLAERVHRTSPTCPVRIADRTLSASVSARRAQVQLICPRGCSGTMIFSARNRYTSPKTFRQTKRRGVHSVGVPRRLRRRIAARGAATGILRIRVDDRTDRYELNGYEHELTQIDRRVRLVDARRGLR